MKTINVSDDRQKRLEGRLVGERGKGFLEITEYPKERTLDVPPIKIIPKSQLRHGAYYRGMCRNATIARWHAGQQMFYYWRTKFGNVYLEGIKHRVDDDCFDVFDAYEEISPPNSKESEIPFDKEGIAWNSPSE